MMLTSTAERVTRNTCESVNEKIRRTTEKNIARYSGASSAAITRRLAELDREWDIERFIETMAPTISLVGLALGAARNRKWLLVPAIVQTFLLQHGLQGWCPPIPVLRRLGVRTLDENNEERYALKALRGDFRQVDRAAGDANQTSAAIDAVER